MSTPCVTIIRTSDFDGTPTNINWLNVRFDGYPTGYIPIVQQILRAKLYGSSVELLSDLLSGVLSHIKNKGARKGLSLVWSVNVVPPELAVDPAPLFLYWLYREEVAENLQGNFDSRENPRPARVMIEVFQVAEIGKLTPGRCLYTGPLDDYVPVDPVD